MEANTYINEVDKIRVLAVQQAHQILIIWHPHLAFGVGH